MAALPLSLSSLIDQCTDVDTDSREADALPSTSSWPLAIRESVWKDRLLFRQRLKARTAALLPSTTSAAFLAFLTSTPAASLTPLFTFSMPALHHALRTTFAFSPPYLSLVHALLTQLRHFRATLYPAALDACTGPELAFAEALYWDEDGEQFTVDEEWVATGMVARVKEVAGKLLVRRKQSEGDADDRRAGARFRNDRRLLRVWIFRLGLEAAIERFQQNQAPERTNTA